jgi:transmembrane sensor
MTRDRQSVDEAATWVNRLDQPAMDTAAGATFDRWMDADAHHRDAFADMQALWQSDALTEALRQHAPAAPVRGVAATAAIRRTRPVRHAIAACIALVAVGLAASELMTTTYRAGHGAGRTVALADGSRVDLSGGTELRVRILPWRRDAMLAQGEAFFDIHHEADRPFTVHSGSTEVRVLGTAFNVDRQAKDRTTVQVYRGAVALESGHDENVVLRMGQGARVVRDRLAAKPAAFDLSQHREPDWRSGWFEASDVPMGVLVDKVRRYADRPIRFADPALADRPVSGRFQVSDPDRVLGAIRTAYGAQVRRDGDAIVISARETTAG